MKTYSYLILMLLLWACNQQPGITLNNSSQIELMGKSIELQRNELEQKLGSLPEKETAVLSDSNGNKYPAQLDDLNSDGKWDVLFTQVDIAAGETKSFTINFDSREDIPVKTNIRFANINDPLEEYTTSTRLTSNNTEITQRYFQFEGPGWENDVVAFRNYFDARNGMDIFGKTITDMVLDQCGLRGGPSYHELLPWGMDILKVGNSLGAGAIALKTPSGLYRVGENCEGTYTLVKEGPLRSIFDLDFANIQLDGNTISLKHRITIEAGKPYYKSQVSINGYDEAKLVSGIVNMHSDSVYSSATSELSFFFTHDNQAYDGEKLGMGIIVPSNNIAVETAPERGPGITQTYYAVIPPINETAEFYFMAGWEKQDNVYATKEGFESELKKQAETIQASVELK